MQMRKVLLAVVAVLFCFSQVNAAEIYRVGIGDPEDSEQGFACKAFKQYVEEKTNGAVEIQLFYNSSLGDETECFRNVQKGNLPFACGGISNLVPFVKPLAVLTLPYIFDNLDQAVAGTTGDARKILDAYAAKAGFHALCWTYTDFRYISNSKHPIKKLADIKDLKFRSPFSAVIVEFYKAVGANPAPISWAETFTALQQGVVDGQCYGYIGFDSMKFLDAHQKYLSEVHYTYQIQPLLMSQRVYKKLTPELQKIFDEGGVYAQEAVLKYEIENAEKAKQKLIGEGLIVDVLEDEDEWKKIAMDVVWPKMADFCGGKDAINAYLAACGKEAWK